MKELERTGYEQFVESFSRRRLLEEESLVLEAAELVTLLMDTEGVNRAELARRLGRSKAYVTQVLRGNANLTLRTLAELGLALRYRIRFQARNVSSGCWISLPDVPRLYSTQQGRNVACWRGFQSVKGGFKPDPAEVQSVEILPLSA